MKHLLLTGATGFLGRFLLRDLLRQGCPVAVLVRGTRQASAASRVEAALQDLESLDHHAIPRPVVLDGELTAPGLGLSSADRLWVARHVGAVLHNAASLTFKSKGPEGEPWRTNVDGTAHVLQLMEELGLAELHYVSTAYVCGLRRGEILETDLRCGQSFGNDYERSKYQAEELVRAAAHLASLTVYRPAIIVGDLRTGFTNTFHGFYTPLQIACALFPHVPVAPGQAYELVGALGLGGTEGKNFVPVDWVSRAISHLLLHPACHDRTYHLTPRERVRVDEMFAVMEEAFVRYALPRKSEAPPVPPTAEGPGAAAGDLDQLLPLFRKQMGVYESYWQDDPVFDSSNTMRMAPHLPCPNLSRDDLLRLCRFAIENNFWWSRGGPAVEGDGPGDWIASAARRAAWRPDLWQVIQLDVHGPGGGSWSLRQLAGGEMEWERGCSPTPPTARVQLSSATFAALRGGELDWPAARRLGAVQIFGAGPEWPVLAEVLRRSLET